MKASSSNRDDTNSKKAGSIFLENFFLEPQGGGASAKPGISPSVALGGAGSRSLALIVPASIPKKDCNKIGDGNNIIAQGCKNVFSKKIQEEEEKKFKARNRSKRSLDISAVITIYYIIWVFLFHLLNI